jgi:hypothetical protein
MILLVCQPTSNSKPNLHEPSSRASTLRRKKDPTFASFREPNLHGRSTLPTYQGVLEIQNDDYLRVLPLHHHDGSYHATKD